MANEWKESNVAAECTLLFGFAFKSAQFLLNGPGIRLVRGDNVKRGHLEWGETTRYWAAVTPELQKYALKKDDIVIGMDGSRVGENFSRIAESDLPALLVQRVTCLRTKGTLLQNYLRYLICNPAFTAYVKAVRTGTSIPHISGKQIGEYLIRIPPSEVQSKIASILGSLDDKIELNRKTAKTLEEMARALFRSWFVDFDPVIDNALAAGNPIPAEFEQRAINRREAMARAEAEGRTFGLPPDQAKLFPNRFEDSDLGPIPAGWYMGQFSEICSNYRKSVAAESINSDEIYIGLEHLPRKSLALTDWGNGSDVSSQKARFRTGQLLFGKLRPYFHKVSLAPFDGICSTDILALESREPELKAQAFLTASSGEMIRYVTAKSDGTRMPRTNWNDLATFRIPIVPKPISISFNNLVEPFFEAISKLPFENESLAQIRDSLLPKLISGEIQVA